MVIQFDETQATAPAQRVTVEQTLDSDLDLRTFRLGTFGFGGRIFEIQANRSSYQARLDLRDELGLYVDVTAGIDIVTGKAFWIFQSIDPATGAPPTDANKGFLPPDLNEGEGQGFVTYTINPKETAETGSTIEAMARIVFDNNDPIDTMPIFNTLDSESPTSKMEALPMDSESAEIVLSWNSDDGNGSGVKAVDLYVSVDGGAFAPAQIGITEPRTVFTCEPGHEYGFFVLAQDNVGNREALKTAAEATTGYLVPRGPASVELTAVPKMVVANGSSTISITAIVRDSRNNTLAGQTVTFTTTLGDLSWTSATTDDGGVATVILTAGTTTGTATVTASVEGAGGIVCGSVDIQMIKLLKPIGDKSIEEGQLLQFRVDITAPEGGTAYCSASRLPEGASFDPTTRLFSWTPSFTQAGTYSGVHFEVTAGGLVDSEDITIMVNNVNQAPVLFPIGNKTVDEGQPVWFTLSAADPDGDALTFTASNLPPGAAFDSATGTFAWTPDYAQAGTYTGIRFEVTDGDLVDSQEITIIVDNVNRAPVLDPIGDKTVNEGERLEFVVSGLDPDGDRLTFSVANLPPGASFDEAAGTFNWRPEYNQAGTYHVHFEVSDGELVESEDIAIRVNDVTPSMLITRLITYLDGLDIHHGIKNSLRVKLINTLDSLDRGQVNAAINQLKAFINEVQAQRGKKLSEAQADELIRAAQEIIYVIEISNLVGC